MLDYFADACDNLPPPRIRYEKFTVGAAEVLLVLERKLGDLDGLDFVSLG